MKTWQSKTTSLEGERGPKAKKLENEHKFSLMSASDREDNGFSKPASKRALI